MSEGGGRRRARGADGGFDSWSQGANNARLRIARGLVVPEGEPRFRLTPQARVFHLGGAFARGFAAALRRIGVQVTSLDPGPNLADPAKGPGLAILDKTTPPAIRQELDWAAEVSEFPREALMPLGDVLVDPCLHERAPKGAPGSLMARRARVAAHFARVFAADLAVLALETTETWFDRRTKLALHGPPLQKVFDADPERFSVRRLGHDEVLAHLKAICGLLRREAPRLRVVLVVSPVPLERTFGAEDVIVANQIAKSTLHAATTHLAPTQEGLDYFPAYEAAITSDPARIWEADRRSPRPEMLEALAQTFVERYGLHLAPDSRTAGTA
jgi:hypothetical protein